MMKAKYDLKLFDGEGQAEQSAQTATNQTTTQTTQTAAQQTAAQPTYNLDQMNEIASARADRAAKAALNSYLKQQGLTEAQAEEALRAYKDAQKAKEPDIDALTRERDEARQKLQAYEEERSLSKKGVSAEDADYVAFKAHALMEEDSKLDFDKAVDKFLKDHPRYNTTASGKPIRISPTSTSQDNSLGKGAGLDHAAINAAIRRAARR